MVVLQKFLGVILKSCLFMDRFFLRAVDWVISSGVPMRFFSDRVRGVRSNISLWRGIIYSLLSLFVVAVGLYCGDSDKSKGLLAKPDKVSNFEITSGNALITISWDATEGASEYKIFMDDDSGTSKLLDMPEETGEKSYSKPFSKGLEGVAMENGIRYAFQILARNSAGEGDKSDKAYGMPRPKNLGTLGGLRANPGSTQATLTWDVNSLATKYIVHRKTSSDTFFNEIETVTKEECSAQECMYVDTGLTNNTHYNYKVIAVMVIDGDGLEATEVKSLNDASALTSTRPRSLSDRQVRITHTVNAMRSLTDGARINLKIREPISLSAVLIRGYEIETLTETGDPLIPNVPVITIRTLSPSTTKSVDQPYGLARQYRVTAQSGREQSIAPISDSQNTIDVPAILPDAPTVSDFMVSGVTAVKSDLSWSTTGRATHYTLQRTSGGSTHALFTKMEKVDLTKMGSKYTFTDTHNLGQGQSYTYDLIPIISGLNVDGVQGTAATQSGTTPTDSIRKVPKALFQSFIAGSGIFALKSNSRVVISSNNMSLVQQLIDILNAPRGWLDKMRYATALPLELVSSSELMNGDILLSDDTDTTFNNMTTNAQLVIQKPGDVTRQVQRNIGDNIANEGYQYLVDATGVKLKFKKVLGALRAIQSVTQLLMLDGRPAGQHRMLPKGTAIDYPKYKSRRVMLDVSRQFQTVEQIVGFMEKMSQHKLNELHMHINDDAKRPGDSLPKGFFRLDIGDADRQGRMTPDNKYYTRANWQKMERAAKRYGIKIIPEFDSPGHASAFIQDNPTLPHRFSSHPINRGILDTGNATKRETNATYVANLILRFREWFSGDTVHIGGDEGTGNEWENDVIYLNLLHSKLKYHRDTNPNGFKTVEMWQDIQENNPRGEGNFKFPITDVDTDIKLIMWIGNGRGNLSQQTGISRKWIDMWCYDFYFVPRSQWFVRGTINPQRVYDTAYKSRITAYADHDSVPDGLAMAVWNDVTLFDRLGVNYINAGISPSFPAMGLVNWYGHIRDGDDNIISYDGLGYDDLIPVSQELLSYWIRDHFPYLDGEQAKGVLLDSARHREIEFKTNAAQDKLKDSGSKDEDWMAWDTDDMRLAFKGPKKFPSGFYIADIPGEGNANLLGRVCKDIAHDLGERESSVCDSDTWSNVISGSGGLQKRGQGSLQLTENNSFQGGVRLDNGTLVVSEGANLGDSNRNVILNGGVLLFKIETGNPVTIFHEIIGSGTIRKEGAGELRLNGVMRNFTGKIEVQAGRLVANTNLGTTDMSIFVAGGATYQPPP